MHDEKKKKRKKITWQNSVKKNAVMAQDESWGWESTVITEENWDVINKIMLVPPSISRFMAATRESNT